MPFTTIAEVIEANKRAGKYWFSPATMRCFDSRVESELIGGRFFVTSEQPPHYKGRRFTVREVLDNGADIGRVGDLDAFSTLTAALAAANRAAVGV